MRNRNGEENHMMIGTDKFRPVPVFSCCFWDINNFSIPMQGSSHKNYVKYYAEYAYGII